MSYNGSGTFQINTSGQPVVAGTVISSTAFNALTADLATGLSTAITKDGQTTTTARIPFAAGINSSLTTDSTSTATGSIITAGGVGVAKAAFIGTTLNVASTTTLTGVATLTANPVLSAGTANGVAYLNGSKALTTGTALVFDGTNLGVGVTPSAWSLLKGLQTVGGGFFGSNSNSTFVGANWYYDGANKYIANGFASRYITESGTHAWYNAASGTAGNAITFTQAMTLNTNGALVLQGGNTSATGIGIAFPATQSASTDANTLDDYEEGTWTPTDGSGAGLTFTTAVGNYTKIGRVVTGSFRVTYPTTASSAQAIISGLPFTVNNTDANYCFVGCYSNATTPISGETGQNTTLIYFYAMGTFTASPNTNISGKTVRGTFTYIV